MINAKDLFICGLILLIPFLLSSQNTASASDESYAAMLVDVELEASYSPMPSGNTMTVYPRVIKKAQVFVLHFDLVLQDPYTVNLVDPSGEILETIYNSQLSIFDAKTAISLEIQTPLESGMYYVVLATKDFSQATKLMKF